MVDWKELQMTWTLEEPTRLAQLLAGETHLTEVNKDLIDQLVAKGYKLIRSRGTAQQIEIMFGGLYFGTEDKTTGRYTEHGGTTGKLDPKLPWTDKKVRQAMNKAINRDELLRVLYKGRAPDVRARLLPRPPRLGSHLGSVSRRCTAMTCRRPNACWRRPAIPMVLRPRPGCSPLRGARTHPPDGVGADPVARGGGRVGTGRERLDSEGHPHDAGPQGQWLPCRPPPSKKAVEAQISVFNAGKAIVHQFETDEIYKMWEELRQLTDPAAVEAQLRKIGNYKFENFEIMPLFDVYIEAVVDPRIIEDWSFSGWDGGDIGHTWLIKACKQEKPCK